jgi:hypothetical protein
MSNDNPDYKVGNCKPPRETQWKPGQSGNPKGRKPGSRSFKSIFLRVADAQPRVNPVLVPNPEPTNLEQIVASQFQRAILGDTEVGNQLIALYRTFTPEADDDETAAPDAAEDAHAAPCKPDGNG